MLIRRKDTTLLFLETARGSFLVGYSDLYIKWLDRNIVVWMYKEGDGMTTTTTVFWHNDAMSKRWKLFIGPMCQ